jgi:hypothetical protein
MNPEPPASVFASYSRTDVHLVSSLIGFLDVVDVPVFRDEQSIKPGKKWRVEIDAALSFGVNMPLSLQRYAASTSVLFGWANAWCRC